MTKLFFSNQDAVALKAKLKSIIEVENEDNLKTHFGHSFLFKDDAKLSGTINHDTFKIWVQEQGRTGITGIFYPIVAGRLRSLNQGLEIEFKFKMNVRRSVLIGIATMLAYGILTGIVLHENNETRYLIPRLFIGLILLGLMLSAPSFVYFKTSRTIIAYLVRELGLRKAP